MGESIETILVVASAIGVAVGGVITSIMRYQDKRRLRTSIPAHQRAQLTGAKDASLEQIINTLISRNIELSEQQKALERTRSEERHVSDTRINDLEDRVKVMAAQLSAQTEEQQKTQEQIIGLTELLAAATARESALTQERDKLKRQNDQSNLRISELEMQVRDLQISIRAEQFARENLFAPFLSKLVGALNGQKVELDADGAAAVGAMHSAGGSVIDTSARGGDASVEG